MWCLVCSKLNLDCHKSSCWQINLYGRGGGYFISSQTNFCCYPVNCWCIHFIKSLKFNHFWIFITQILSNFDRHHLPYELSPLTICMTHEFRALFWLFGRKSLNVNKIIKINSTRSNITFFAHLFHLTGSRWAADDEIFRKKTKFPTEKPLGKFFLPIRVPSGIIDGNYLQIKMETTSKLITLYESEWKETKSILLSHGAVWYRSEWTKFHWLTRRNAAGNRNKKFKGRVVDFPRWFEIVWARAGGWKWKQNGTN